MISKAPGARLAWVKSSYSGAQGNCVEVAVLPGGGYALRDSKAPQGPALAFGPETFAAFLSGGMVQAVVVRPAR
ncbi:DUF397 domain-containing protein [Streptomyces sp. LP05-1]|uniref:DUF397 domain-containing protein n=1 Tax=Streptomyces pyxinae TaxID=2970734 RepID=A0ABT2CI40_9ACTN|nr:DUF397 domain-containing protein [Streptomyces sp. LP05-1]